MSELPFAEPADLEARWRPLTEAETLTALTLLADASDMVREQYPDVDARVSAGTLRASTLARVTAGMVKRALVNAEGKREESIDDYSWTLDPNVSSGYLFLSANDKTALAPLRTRRAFAVDLG